MAYPIISTTPDENNIKNLLFDIANRKEYYIFKEPENREYYDVRGFISPNEIKQNFTQPNSAFVQSMGLQLSTAQLFVRNFQNPNTEFTRLLINWQTGVGKSIAAISIGNEFIRQYRINAVLGEKLATVFIIGFTIKATIREDMLKYPEFGFVSKAEADYLLELRQKTATLNNLDPEVKKLSNLLSTFGRRITDKSRGGNYSFYGYKEFANRLFIITQKGIKDKFDVQSLFMPSKVNEDDIFTDIIEKAIKDDYIIINNDLLNELKNGLIIADEIHNVYNILAKNNYGIAIQYVLDILKDDAPRAVFMSATPMTGSASEIVDLLNLLVPKPYLTKTLKRSDFFCKTTKRIDLATLNSINLAESKYDHNIMLHATAAENKSLKTAAKTKLLKAAAAAAKEIKFYEENTALQSNIQKNNTIFIHGKEISISQLKEHNSANDEIDDIAFDHNFLVSELKKGASQQISYLSAGRVSFLLDTDLNLYPKRIFIGESYDNIPYLKITKCPMSPLHEKTIDYEHATALIGETKKEFFSGFSPRAYSLYDCVFPNPNESETQIGLYKSIETPLQLLQETAKWKAENGVIVEQGQNRGLLTNTLLIGGSYLHKSTLAKYSTKYHALITAVINAIKNGTGKIMIYHHRVKMSGVLLIAEILIMNGFIDPNMEPIDSTRCSICGISRKKHNNAEHTYIPARFIVAHSDIDSTTMAKNIHQFNSILNLDGNKYKIILGSKIIREGLNFFAVRYQFITSLPTDYPTLIQVFGRVIRKGSHLSLPEDKRDVKIQIFVSTREDDKISPELNRYINKGKEYLVIQEVEKALREYAVDAYANYDKIKKALPLASNGEILPSLDSIPYRPISINEIDPSKLKLTTFRAYGYSEREVYVITYILRILFENCPVWTYDDLWDAVITGQVGNINYNHLLFDKNNFIIALFLLKRASGSPPKIITNIGKYFIQSGINNITKKPNIDFESFIRNNFHPKKKIKIKISTYLSKKYTSNNFIIYINIFKTKYIDDKNNMLELALIDFNSVFHINFMKMLIIEDKQLKSNFSKEQLAQIINMYKRFKLIITPKDIPSENIKKYSKHEFIMGYKEKDIIHLYFDNKEWKTVSHSDIGINLYKLKENNIVIGFTTDDKGIYSKFKTRPPVQKLTIAQDKKNDIRSLSKGAICETRIKEDLFFQVQELKAYAKKLSITYTNENKPKTKTNENKPKTKTKPKNKKLTNKKTCDSTADNPFEKRLYPKNASEEDDASDDEASDDEASDDEQPLRSENEDDEQPLRSENEDDEQPLRSENDNELSKKIQFKNKLEYAANFDKSEKKYPSSFILCNTLKIYLLLLEEYSRNDRKSTPLKWLYLFDDKLPSISI